MEKIIKIGEQDVTLSNNMAWVIEYKEQFNTDIMPAIMPLISTVIEGLAVIISDASENGELTAAGLANAVEGRTNEILLPLYNAEFADLAINITWAMAKAADESIDPPKKWVRQFDTFPVDTIVPEVFKLVLTGMISRKNLKRLKNLAPMIKSLQPSLQTISSSAESTEG